MKKTGNIFSQYVHSMLQKWIKIFFFNITGKSKKPTWLWKNNIERILKVILREVMVHFNAKLFVAMGFYSTQEC